MTRLDTTNLPPALAQQAQRAWNLILEHCEPPLAEQLWTAAAALPEPGQLPRMLSCSVFVAELARRQPTLLLTSLSGQTLHTTLAENAWRTELEELLAAPGADLAVILRRFRQRHMLRILWRDFCRLANTIETTRDMSLLAEACIAAAQSHCHAALCERFGEPRSKRNGSKQQLIVIGMGKLGARELNVSSDIDLIFTFPEGGQTDGERQISNEQFFTKLGQGLISALDQITGDGFVFRVDMRLRPYGESGSLVHSFSALESYYQEQGRDWERYALIKARPLTGDPGRARELMRLLHPFVYRRYIDFGVIDSLRDMKRMITTEVRRRGLQDDIKLGHGGIREIEFIAQCFQLIRGGRDLGLQQRELLPVLDECAALDCLPASAAQELRAAYLFLRDSEHAIQGYRDQQTQALPQEQLPRLALALVLGSDSWEEYLGHLQAHRDRVLAHFDKLIAEPRDEPKTGGDERLLWGEQLTTDALLALGYAQAEPSLERLQQLQGSNRVVALQAEGRERLAQFMPQLLLACAEADDPDLALQRLLPLVTAVLRRSAYLALLLENPPALAELVVLCAASPWIADQLARHPVLLDELLDRSSLYNAPDAELLRDELRQQVARLAVDDLEAQMDALRYFKASHVLRVAASELGGRLPLMQVSDKLTWLAEVILAQVLAVAWADLCAKYGEPARAGDGYGLAIYAYGKLGGIELSYSSDLDLLFVSDANATGVTNGQRSIDNAVFYTRLGQRIIHILETRMTLGQLYEVDMRLRPSGNSGMLVTTSAGLRSYQLDSAWTWEHQALVRARQVAGDALVGTQVDTLRREILCQRRDQAELAREVVAMRQRMREHLLPKGAANDGEFHLKQGRGGIVDIEFMVQYAVLAWSHQVPGLTRWSDNVRILETLAREGLFEQRECDQLTEAYLAYRSAAHQLALQQQPDLVPAAGFRDQRAAVEAKWQQLFAPYMDV